jgi:hypothetical protein
MPVLDPYRVLGSERPDRTRGASLAVEHVEDKGVALAMQGRTEA